MKYRTHQFAVFLLSLFVGSFILVGCGGKSDESADTDASSENTSSEASESSGSTSDWTVDDYHDWFEKFVVTVEGVETKEDVEEAEPQIKETFEKMADMVKHHKDDPAWTKAEDDERMTALRDRMEKHLEALGKKSPMVAMALGFMIAKHGSTVFAELGGAMPNMTGEQQKEMQDAMKELDALKEKLGN